MPNIAEPTPAAEMTLDQVIRMFVLYQLSIHNGNRTHAARALGVCVRTLRKYIRIWHLDIDFPSSGPGRGPKPLERTP